MMTQLYTIFGRHKAEIHEKLPKEAKIIKENVAWMIVRSSMTWDEIREHYGDVATVGKCEQKEEDL